MQHKWHKEIKAWADGAEIEYSYYTENDVDIWLRCEEPLWNEREKYQYRIKPQPFAKCVVKDCMNHTNEGPFVGDLCGPCWDYLTNGNGVHSQAYRNAHPKEPQYLYVYFNQKSQDHKQSYFVSYSKPSAVESCGYIYLGKIKLEE